MMVNGDRVSTPPQITASHKPARKSRAALIKARAPDVQAVEMEAAAIAQTCAQFGLPFVVIRAVSDAADEKADVSFDEFLQTAAVHSAEMVDGMIREL